MDLYKVTVAYVGDAVFSLYVFVLVLVVVVVAVRMVFYVSDIRHGSNEVQGHTA